MKDESMKTAVESSRILSAAGSPVDEQRSSLENEHAQSAPVQLDLIHTQGARVAFLLDYIPAIPPIVLHIALPLTENPFQSPAHVIK